MYAEKSIIQEALIPYIERRPLFDDIERAAITLQFTLTGTEGFYLFAVLVIDIVPALRRFDMANTLRLHSKSASHSTFSY